ncbi:SCP2 sterol-binding domain-containing protein [Streptomyces sp. NBC_00385]|uniref:SCP2 sterol-binding domain-containing protein n=1 Tax=Streptomyces sp. NBC_00385 TaxID=2975733 RepID=UPI002DD82211|nr:SCP2 sterol-binding domain-containing protein [Streptomyces sp. NBC_00385]WRZ09065.1 SCP2 sterol-binding domain-containing protein [Streptomyces sp. NBC_00385]
MGERRESETFHPGWAVLGMEAYFEVEAAEDVRAVYEFRVGDEVFHVRVDGGTIEALHGPAQHPGAVVEADEVAFAALAEGRSDLGDAIGTGTLSASGDRDALNRLPRLFRRPSAADRHPPAP